MSLISLPALRTGCSDVDIAWRIALGDMSSNILPYNSPYAGCELPSFMAGLGYPKPWTRDAAFNTWYGGLVAPEVARNTLLSVLTDEYGDWQIGGQYWDAIIWVTGAWTYYLYMGDGQFLETAYSATVNTLNRLEAEEQDPDDVLFRGGACFMDGVSGYPDAFGDPAGRNSSILGWIKRNPDKRHPVGSGLPIKALSTNCLYYNAYRLVNQMASALGQPTDDIWEEKAEALKQSINARFWDEDSGAYHYLIDAQDDQMRQEGLGYAFAILFGVADENQVERLLNTYSLTEHGIACAWPPYERYMVDGEFPRHSGTVWPQVNAAWVGALVAQDQRDAAWKELSLLANKASRDGHFHEIYHPETGEPYGGVQENSSSIISRPSPEMTSCQRQTWCATGYVYMVFQCLLGMTCTTEGLQVKPWLPDDIDTLEITGLPYRKSLISLTVQRGGTGEVAATVDADGEGAVVLELSV